MRVIKSTNQSKPTQIIFLCVGFEFICVGMLEVVFVIELVLALKNQTSKDVPSELKFSCCYFVNLNKKGGEWSCDRIRKATSIMG